MNTRLVWVCVLIMVLVIIPGSVIIGVFFSGLWMIIGIPIALFFIPPICIVVALLSLFAIRDPRKRKSMTIGVLVSGLLWGTLFTSAVIVPSKIQWTFRHAVPGLAQADLDSEGKQIAAAVNGTFIQSFVSEGDSRIEVKGWRDYVNASVNNGSLSIQGGPTDSLPSRDSVIIVRRLSEMSRPFLNARGKQVMQASNIQLRSESMLREFDVYVMDAGNIAIRSSITVHGLSFTISKGYSVLDE